MLSGKMGNPKSIVRDRKLLLTAIGGMVWVCAVCAGFAVLWNYGNTPGASAHAPRSWPTASRLRLAGNLPTLVMIAHPHCPCTRASMTELSVLMTRCQGKLAATVLFVKPEGFDEQWEQTDLWHEASRIPGVAVVSDAGGVEAARFGAATSGQTLLYDSKGDLRFSGGITSARAHEGDNDGLSAIQSLVVSADADRSTTPVFGCPLQDSPSKCQAGMNDAGVSDPEVNDANDNGQ
jgi:hypothetical protein